MQLSLLDIEPIKINALDCYELLVANVAIWAGRRYEMYFSTEWNLDYDLENVDGLIGTRLHGGTVSNEHLEKYHGIKITTSATASLTHLRDALYNEHPLGACVDARFIPWDEHFGDAEYEGEHCFLITGLNEAQGKLYCVDPYYNKNQLEFHIVSFMSACKEMYSFQFADSVDCKPDLNDFFHDVLQLHANQKTISSIKNLIRDFTNMNSEDIKNEFYGFIDQDFHHAPLFASMNTISRNRKKFSTSLAYISLFMDQNKTNLTGLIKKFESMGSMWMIATKLAYKCYSNNEHFEGNKQLLINKLLEVADLEEEAVAAMKHYLQVGVLNVHIHSAAASQPLETIGNIIHLDLFKYFNNHGIGNWDDNTADLTGTGYYFLSDTFPDTPIIGSGKLTFISPKTSIQINDNISCLGQTLEIPYHYAKCISLLGCSEYGSFSERVVIHYENNESIELILEFSEWNCQIPQFNDQIFWHSKIANRLLGPIDEAHFLFTNFLKVRSRRRIAAIQLPVCPNLHIFAASLIV